MRKILIILSFLPAVAFGQRTAANNLTTAKPGQFSLDAYQGKVLNDSLTSLALTVYRLRDSLAAVQRVINEPFVVENARKGSLSIMSFPNPNSLKIRSFEAGPGIKISYTDSTVIFQINPTAPGTTTTGTTKTALFSQSPPTRAKGKAIK